MTNSRTFFCEPLSSFPAHQRLRPAGGMKRSYRNGNEGSPPYSGGENGIKKPAPSDAGWSYLQRGLNRHRRFDSRVRIVTFNLEVFKAVVEDRRRLAFDDQLRQRTRFAA